MVDCGGEGTLRGDEEGGLFVVGGFDAVGVDVLTFAIVVAELHYGMLIRLNVTILVILGETSLGDPVLSEPAQLFEFLFQRLIILQPVR